MVEFEHVRAEVIRGFHPANREEKSTELGLPVKLCLSLHWLVIKCQVLAVQGTARVPDFIIFHMMSIDFKIDFLIFTNFNSVSKVAHPDGGEKMSRPRNPNIGLGKLHPTGRASLHAPEYATGGQCNRPKRF